MKTGTVWLVIGGLAALLLFVACTASELPPTSVSDSVEPSGGTETTPLPTNVPTSTAIPAPTVTLTPVPTVTPTPVPTATVMPSPTVTLTPIPSPVVTIWRPALKTSWQWQLVNSIDTSIDVAMYDVDLFDVDVATVAALHAEGRKVVCYMNAGGWESWRADADQFPDDVVGGNLDDWEREKWLDIRRLDVLGPIMKSRMDLCKAKGFDGIEPDNVDGFLNETGLPLTYEDQLRYNIWLADQAHERGLSIGLKNDMDQIPDLLTHFDWALNEQCFEFEECETLLPFIQAGKAVFHVEYELDVGEFCDQAIEFGLNSMKKGWDLDPWREPCE